MSPLPWFGDRPHIIHSSSKKPTHIGMTQSRGGGRRGGQIRTALHRGGNPKAAAISSGSAGRLSQREAALCESLGEPWVGRAVSTEGGLRTSPKTEGTGGHTGWGICGVQEQSGSDRGNAGRVSLGHSEPMQCRIQKTFRKWDLTFRGQGERSMAKNSENWLHDQAWLCAGQETREKYQSPVATECEG